MGDDDSFFAESRKGNECDSGSLSGIDGKDGTGSIALMHDGSAGCQTRFVVIEFDITLTGRCGHRWCCGDRRSANVSESR